MEDKKQGKFRLAPIYMGNPQELEIWLAECRDGNCAMPTALEALELATAALRDAKAQMEIAAENLQAALACAEAVLAAEKDLPPEIDHAPELAEQN